jgi:hypothetical protein
MVKDLFAMSRIKLIFAAAGLAMCFAGAGRADEPIRAPRVVPVLPAVSYELMPPLQGTTGRLPPPPTTRQNRYEHWQYVGPTQTGEMRPRVLYLPDTSVVWAIDGTWYPWLTTHPTWVVPFFISQ